MRCLAFCCLFGCGLVYIFLAGPVQADDPSDLPVWEVSHPDPVLAKVPFTLTIKTSSPSAGDTVYVSQPSTASVANWDLGRQDPHEENVVQPLPTYWILQGGHVVVEGVRVHTGETALKLSDHPVRPVWWEEVHPRVLPGWLSLLPPLLAIGLALLSRQVIVALLVGIWVGALILSAWNPLTAFMRLGDQFLVAALADESHAAILLFSTILGGMIGILSRCGATEGIVNYLAGKVRGRRGGQVATAVMGTVIFFDDYANTLLVGNTMRPLTDRLRISREKLAYIVDSTAAPVTTIAVISTWVGFEVGLIQDAMDRFAGGGSAYSFFLRSIPYGFYPILTLLFVYLVTTLGRDYGPMFTAEQRAATTGEVLRPGAQPASDTKLFEDVAQTRSSTHPLVAALPILIVILVTAVGLWLDGLHKMQAAGVAQPSFRQIINTADSYAVLMWASLSGALSAALLAWGSGRMSLRETVESWVAGAKAMLIAVVILILAWTLSEVCSVLQTANYLVELCRGGLPAFLLPSVTFLLAAAIGFATGTSWGTMAILMPLIYPLGAILPEQAGLATHVTEHIHLASVSAVLAGAVFGDHCSPISDTTILSSLASGSDHVDHVRTQLPYAATVASVALVVGYLPVGFGLSPWISLLSGIVLLAGFVLWRGRPVQASEEAE